MINNIDHKFLYRQEDKNHKELLMPFFCIFFGFIQRLAYQDLNQKKLSHTYLKVLEIFYWNNFCEILFA